MLNKLISVLVATHLFTSFANISYSKEREPEPRSVQNINFNAQGFIGRDFVVTSASPIASEIGKQILENGGNAMDALIAVQMVLNLVEPQSSGIGGGGFITYYKANEKQKDKKMIAYMGRETTPASFDEKAFLDKNGKPIDFFTTVRNAKSVATPGLLMALKQAHEDNGKMSWADLFKPAIDLAENGFPISERLYTNIKEFKNKTPNVTSDIFAQTNNIYFNSDGEAKRVGDRLYNKELANTFKLISQNVDRFYRGKISKDIVKKIQSSGGVLSESDLINYKPIKYYILSDLNCVPYRKYKVCTTSPPSSGFTILEALGILNNINLSQYKDPSSPEVVHYIVEALKFAMADRNKYIADPNFVHAPFEDMVKMQAYKKEAALLINKDKASKGREPYIFSNSKNYDNLAHVDKSFENVSTSHITVIDKEGNVANMTTSIEQFFGSGISVDGFLLNNTMTDFSFKQSLDDKLIANRVEGCKIKNFGKVCKVPRSSMSPTFVFDENDNLIAALGSAGGVRIIDYVLKVVVAIIDFDKNIQQAINLPNFANLNAIETEVEDGREDTKELVQGLIKKGHKIVMTPLFSGIQGITKRDGIIVGGADPRRSGMAVGK